MQDTVWIRRLFFGLAMLYLLPVWTVRYLPTTDGPCHTYNAWILQQLWSGEASPLIRGHYEVHARPFPNWTGQAVMALLLFVVPPLVAEKVMVSAALLLFLGGAWSLAGAVRPDVRWPALLAFPFAYNLIFQYGFYNFYLSLGMYLAVLAVWWRHRTRPDLSFAMKINLLLLLCYFSHIVSLVLALFSIAVLWLATLRRESWRAHLLHVPILIPQLILPVWFLHSQDAAGLPPSSSRSVEALLSYLVPPEVLIAFSGFQRWLAVLVTAAFLLLVALTVWGRISRAHGERRTVLVPEDGFLLLTAALLVLYLMAPEGMAGGYILPERLSLYPWLVLIPWLAPRLGAGGRATAVAALTLMTLANLDYLVQWYGTLDREIGRFVDGFDDVRPQKRVLALLFQRQGPALRTEILGHTTGYVALERDLIDWDNYQAKVPFFPVRFRSSVRLPDLRHAEIHPELVRLRKNQDLVDAIYVWQMPPGHPLARRLRRSYRLVAEKDGGMLWERKRHRHHFRKQEPAKDTVQLRR